MNSEERQKGSGHHTGQTTRKKCFFSTKVKASDDGSSSSRQHTGLGMRVAVSCGPAHPLGGKSPQNHEWGPTAQHLDSCLKSYNIFGTVKQQMVTTFGLTQDKNPKSNTPTPSTTVHTSPTSPSTAPELPAEARTPPKLLLQQPAHPARVGCATSTPVQHCLHPEHAARGLRAGRAADGAARADCVRPQLLRGTF